MVHVQDMDVWHGTNNGKYSVIMGYRLWNDQHRHNAHIPSSSCSNKLWNLNISHKIIIFLWRLGRENLRVRSISTRKGVSLTHVCLFCATEIQKIHHILINYVFAKSCWQEIDQGHDTLLLKDQDLVVWLLNDVSSEKKKVIL